MAVWPPSSAHERLTQRGIGGALALLVQAAAVLLFVIERPVPSPRLPRETILLLPQLPKPAPPLPAPHFSGPQTVAPVMPVIPPATPAPSLAPPSGIAGFGRALFGCAPENYASLPPDERARCPKPAEGLALQHDPDLMGTRSHVKDEAHWRQEWARVHSPGLLPCGGFTDPLCLLTKILDGSLDDYGDPSKWPTYAVRQLPSEDLYKIKQAYDQWHKDHPVK